MCIKTLSKSASPFGASGEHQPPIAASEAVGWVHAVCVFGKYGKESALVAHQISMWGHVLKVRPAGGRVPHALPRRCAACTRPQPLTASHSSPLTATHSNPLGAVCLHRRCGSWSWST